MALYLEPNLGGEVVALPSPGRSTNIIKALEALRSSLSDFISLAMLFAATSYQCG